jgi:GNAT superfamily N-acetyltransferase
MLIALYDEKPVGFKIGYRENRFVFYSAKGGVLESYRTLGVARAMMYAMIDQAQLMGYRRFAYDTFPNMHPGMTIMGLREGFRVVRADFNQAYHDFRLRFERKL